MSPSLWQIGVVIVLIVLLFGNYLNTELVYYLSYAVTLAGVVQLIFLILYSRKFYFPKFSK